MASDPTVPADLTGHDPVVVVWMDHAFNRGPASEHDQDLIRFVTVGFQLPEVLTGRVHIAQSYNVNNEEYEDILVLDARTIIDVWPLLK